MRAMRRSRRGVDGDEEGVLIVSTRGSNVDLMHVLFGTVLALDAAALTLLCSGCSCSNARTRSSCAR